MKKRIMLLTLVLAVLFVFFTSCSNETAVTETPPVETPESTPVPAPEPAPEPTIEPEPEVNAQPGNGSEGSETYVKGYLSDKDFYSEYLELQFTLPDGFIMATDEDIANMTGISADVMGLDPALVDWANYTTVYEMMAATPIGAPNVIVMVERLMLSNITVEQYLDILMSQLAELGFGYEFSDVETVGIAGKSYEQITATANMGGQDMIQRYIIRKQDNMMIAFILTSTPDTEGELETLMNGFSKY